MPLFIPWGVCAVCGYGDYTHSDTCPNGWWECYDCFYTFPNGTESYEDEGDTLCWDCLLRRDEARQDFAGWEEKGGEVAE